MSMQNFVVHAKKCFIVVLVLGIVFYAFVMLLYCFDVTFAKRILESAPASKMFGLPICGLVAFGIVALLDAFAPSTNVPAGTQSQSALEFVAFGLKFSGPAGPITLWIAVYLTLVASIQIAK